MLRRALRRRVEEPPGELPLPPLEMRRLVGPTEDSFFDNPEGALVVPELPPEQYRSVLDFGCGCGRLARQLIQQRPRPERYVGIDLHRGMIDWCRRNLGPRADGFEFLHHDVLNAGFNPGEDKPLTAPFPAPDGAFSLVLAWSVFTHLVQDQVEHYLREVARVLEPTGACFSTWFLFEKADFPMMQDFQHALYINDVDPTNAVIYDRDWVRAAARAAGLTVHGISAPDIRGFQWRLLMTPSRDGVTDAEFPLDDAPRGSAPPPLTETRADQIGLDGS